MLDDIKKTLWATADKLRSAHASLFQRTAGLLTPERPSQVVHVMVELQQAGV